jgi:peptidoglycan/LPS O-acetylase OafA/YrhL
MRAGPIFVGLACARLYRTPGFMARLAQTGWAGTLGLVLAFAVGLAVVLLPADAELPRPLEVAYLASYRTVFGIAVAYGMLLVLTEHAVGRWFGRFLAAPLFFPLGQISYTTYLLNPIVATLSHGAFGPLLPSVGATVAVLSLVDVPLSFAAGFSLSVLVERPFMELRRFVAVSPLAAPVPAQPAA